MATVHNRYIKCKLRGEERFLTIQTYYTYVRDIPELEMVGSFLYIEVGTNGHEVYIAEKD